MTEPQSWDSYCQRRPRNGEWHYEHFGAEQWVRLCFPGTVVPVTLVEDRAGSHYGWVEPDGRITMVQPSRPQFEVQFPYGWRAEQDRGHGRKVRVRVEEREWAW